MSLLRALRYFIGEAWVSLVAGRRSSVLAIATIAAALFVLGAFLLLTTNLRQLVSAWGSAAEMSVYLRDGVTSEERQAVEAHLTGSAIVSTTEFVSKDEALQRFAGDFGDLAGVATSLPENPLPASFEVRLQGEAQQGPAIDALAAELGRLPAVVDVRYDRRWLDRLVVAVTLARGIGAVLASVLMLAAGLTVANVVRLAFHARRDEVEIMGLVGAPAIYIRGPFVTEGILQGGLGACCALLLLWGGFLAARTWYAGAAGDLFGQVPFEFFAGSVCGLLVLGGMVLGSIGGWIASRPGI